MSYKAIVVVTGVGLKQATRFFKQPDPADIVNIDGKKYKMNSPAGAAVELNKAGYLVYMIGGCENYMKHLGRIFLKNEYYYKQLDLSNKDVIKKVVKEIKELKNKTNLDVHLVYYGGMSGNASKVTLPKETVALSPWEIPTEIIGQFVDANSASLLNIVQEMKEIFNSQDKSKIVIISAISAIRTKRLHTLDALQKAAIHAMARSMALDFTKERIYITEIMPGITDTGFYDDPTTLKAMKLAAKSEN
jgi:NAD(P)-dependent dehydrogenase (short-subunit alcohol dehydrogenase family)